MKINDLELFLVAVGHADSSEPAHSLLVRVSTAAGLDGWGEAGTPWRASELSERRNGLLAILAGRSIYDIEEVRALESLQSAGLRSAVEMALWDLIGRRMKQPLCNLFGGFFRRRAPVSVRLAGRRPDQIAHVARERADQGFHTQTLVSSGRSEEDLATLAAVRERVGDRVELRLDGMSHYDFETARNLCASQECEGLQFFLDPLDSPDLHRLASLGRQANVPMAAWRAIRGPADVMAAVRCGAAPYLLIDLEQVGGLGPARACAAVAEAAGVHPILGGQPSVGIAAAAMLQLAAAAPAFSGSNEIALCPLRDSVLVEPLSTIEGMMPVPQGPGLGVEVNRAKVEKCQAA